jgi:hypothetical protein
MDNQHHTASRRVCNGRPLAADRPDHLFAEALKLHRRGWCVLPSAGKRPAVERYKQIRSPADRPSEADLAALLARPGVSGLGVLTGPASGGLVNRDFDVADAYRLWSLAHPRLAAELPTAATRRGFHVFARANFVGTHPLGDGEIRAGTFVVLPPSKHPDGGVYAWLIPPVDKVPEVDVTAAGFTRRWFPAATEAPERQNGRDNRAPVTETTKTSSVVSVTGADSVTADPAPAALDAVQGTLPQRGGERNLKLFGLARRLRALPELAGADLRTLRPVVRLWHSRALAVIRTKAFDDTWADFVRAWEAVRFADGDDPLVPALERARTGPEPAAARAYDTPAVRLLVALCRELQRAAGPQPFFLSCRSAARILALPGDVAHVTANRYLRMLVADGVLELVQPGGPESMKAHRFRYLVD